MGSVTTLADAFYGARLMDMDAGSWDVSKVADMTSTFIGAINFKGAGLSKWNVAAVTSMAGTFSSTALTSCNKRKIVDAWTRISTVFVDTTTYDTDWAADACPPLTDIQFKQASWDWVQNTGTVTTKWGDIGEWDMSGVGDFSYAFSIHRNEAGGSYVGNGNPKAATFVGTAISKWNTASATSLYRTFEEASEMNADLTGWKVGKVVTLQNTFFRASKFTGTGLALWNTASATSLRGTFWGASEMNADLTGWMVGKVVTLEYTFYGASKFTGTGLSAWDTASATSLHGTFQGASVMNADLSTWNVVKVSSMTDTFTSTPSLSSCNKVKIADAWKSNSAFVATTYDTDWSTSVCMTDVEFKKATWGTLEFGGRGGVGF
jgi:hypothetical protein